MVEAIVSTLDEFGRAFRIVDAADILLVSVVIYAGLLWFQQTASRGVLIGVSALGVVYFLARGLDMHLTSLAFHATFAVLLFILVILFQEDLRRMFERLSDFRSMPLAPSTEVGLEADELIEAAFHMAANNTGALMAIKGKDPLQRHLNGGVPLSGMISKPLLYSIFSADTPGHDGAVVVEGNRIVEFAAHLPISKNARAIAGRGTRHSAALGLSERSDALVIVVSEERGVVSIAESGRLKEMAAPAELKRHLDRFLAPHSPTTTRPSWKRFIIQHGPLKIFALLLAIIAWFVLAYDPSTVQQTFVVPIEYRNLSEQLVLEQGAPNEARVTLSGSERNFRFLEPSSLKVSVDLANVGSGFQQIPITESNIRLPINLYPYRIEPRILYLNLARKPNSSPATAKGTP